MVSNILAPLSSPPVFAPQQVRVVTERAYHALFMHNMLIRPSEAELEEFGEPDFVIYNAGALLTDLVASMGARVCVVLYFKRRGERFVGKCWRRIAKELRNRLGAAAFFESYFQNFLFKFELISAHILWYRRFSCQPLLQLHDINNERGHQSALP